MEVIEAIGKLFRRMVEALKKDYENGDKKK